MKKSTENLASRPGSVRARSPGAAGPDTQEEPTSCSRQELVAVPSQTIFMQAVEFLLEVKAMPVGFNFILQIYVIHQLINLKPVDKYK